MGYGKRIVLLGCSGAIAIVIAFALFIVGSLWYQSRPIRWDKTSIIASFNFIEIEGNRYPCFCYTLENKTDADFYLDYHHGSYLYAKEIKPSPPREQDSTYVRIDLPIFIPAKHKLNIKVHSNYEFDLCDIFDTWYLDEKSTRAARAKLVRKQIPNLDGFVLIDRKRLYLIDFWRGW
jgi:hypothetical protein